MPPFYRKPFGGWITGEAAKAASAPKKSAKNWGPIKGTAPTPPPNLGALRPELNPRLTVQGSQVLVELGGNKITLDQLEALVKQAGAPKDLMAEVARLKQVEAAIKQLPPTEGGRLASFEQARALAAAKQGGDPTSAHYDPNRKRRFIPKPIDKKVEQPTAAKRFEKDLGGTPSVPSKVEELLPEEANSLITKGRAAIDAMGKNEPVVTARTMSRIFERAEILVREGKVSQEVANSIRNRVVETLMKVPGGDEVLRAMKMGDIRATMSKADQKTLARKPKGKKGRQILSQAQSRIPPSVAQDEAGNLVPRQEGRGMLSRTGSNILKELSNLIQPGTLDPMDIAAASEAKAMGRANNPTKSSPLSPLARLRQIVEARRPAAKPAADLPYNRGQEPRSSADIRALKALVPKEIGPSPEVQAILASTSDPDLLVQKLSKVLGMSPEELAPRVDRLLDARADVLRSIAMEVNKPSRERVAVITGTTKSGKSKGASQVEQMSLQEAQALVEGDDRAQAIGARSQPPMSIPRQRLGASVTRGMERATTAPYEDQQRQILKRFVQRLQSSGVPLEKIAALLRYIS